MTNTGMIILSAYATILASHNIIFFHWQISRHLDQLVSSINVHGLQGCCCQGNPLMAPARIVKYGSTIWEDFQTMEVLAPGHEEDVLARQPVS